MIQKINSKVLKVKKLTKTVKQIFLSTPKDFKFKSGQYILLEQLLKNQIQRRAYSIASAPNEKKNQIELCIKLSDKSPFLNEINKTKKSKKVSFMGPAGNFQIENASNDLVFVSVGSGIAPLKSMIEDLLLNKNSKKQIILIHGYRHKKDILYKKEFSKLEKQFQNFKQNIVLSKPKKISKKILKGHVQDFIKEIIPNPKENDYYICGMKEMVTSATEKLKSLKVKENQIHFEKYN